MTVATYINVFEVKPGRDEEFVEHWREVSMYMRAKPGFVGLRLHRALTDGASNRFINYVNWRSADDLRAAHDEGFRALVQQEHWQSFPSLGQLYEIVDSSGTITV